MCARILVVDDDPVNVDLLGYLLKAFGHHTRTALSGEEALEISRTAVPDLVLCDLHMPGIDGFEVLRRMRADARLAAARVVAVTALAMVGDRDKVMSAGFDGYISKPIDPETFIPEVEKFLPAGDGVRPMFHDEIVPQPPAGPAPDIGKTVLIVDDSPDARDMLAYLLRSRGIRVEVAASGAEGFTIAGGCAADLVILDVRMPEVGGLELLRKLRGTEALAGIPVMFLTSTGNPEDRARGLALGAVRFLIRPIEPEALLSEISTILGVQV